MDNQEPILRFPIAGRAFLTILFLSIPARAVWKSVPYLNPPYATRQRLTICHTAAQVFPSAYRLFRTENPVYRQ